jgi:hypothetical protein
MKFKRGSLVEVVNSDTELSLRNTWEGEPVGIFRYVNGENVTCEIPKVGSILVIVSSKTPSFSRRSTMLNCILVQQGDSEPFYISKDYIKAIK